MEPSTETAEVVNEEDSSAVVEESENVILHEKATFKGKLDLTSFGYSLTATLRSASRASPIQRREAFAEDGSKNQDDTRSLSRKRRTTSTNRLSPMKRKKSSGYAPPSTYAHLPPLPDTLQAGLICVFIGLNPGIV